MIVVDSSYALAMVMRDEALPTSVRDVMAERLIAPAILPLEIANAMRSNVRRKRLLADQVPAVCEDLGELGIAVVASSHASSLRHFHASAAYDLTPYDACYVELAAQRNCGLATLDDVMATAALRAGLTVYR